MCILYDFIFFKSKATLDYILVRRKWRNSIKDVNTSEAFSSIGSDHRLLVARVKVTLRKKKIAPGRPNLDYSALKKDPDLQERFSVEVRNRFSALSPTGCEATEKYGNLIQAVEETSRKLLGKKRKRVKDIVAEDFRVKRAREEVEAATTRYHTSPSDDTRSAVNEGKEALTEAYLVVEEEILDSKIKDVERATRNAKTKESWRLIDDISGRKGRQPIQIEGASPEDRKAKWFSHFQSLLGSEPPDDEDLEVPLLFPRADIYSGPFTGEEFKKAKDRIKEDKAYGSDAIAPEILKRCDLDEIVLGFCNDALDGKGIPEQWTLSNLVPVPKKGDLTRPGNYRGIALTSIVAKTMNRMILHRIRPHIESVLLDSQNGFREGRSTVSHILALRRVFEGATAKQLPLAVAFLDFVKAFDSINSGPSSYLSPRDSHCDSKFDSE